jgi:Rrf2 family protein
LSFKQAQGAIEEHMEISRQTDYAIRAIEYLSRMPAEELVQTKEIAKQQGIPEKYLPTIVRTLARAGLLKTMRGNHGGIRLSRPPEEISLRDVVEAIDGPFMLNRSMIQPGENSSDGDSLNVLHDVWDRISGNVRDELESVRMSDLFSD